MVPIAPHIFPFIGIIPLPVPFPPFSEIIGSLLVIALVVFSPLFPIVGVGFSIFSIILLKIIEVAFSVFFIVIEVGGKPDLSLFPPLFTRPVIFLIHSSRFLLHNYNIILSSPESRGEDLSELGNITSL